MNLENIIRKVILEYAEDNNTMEFWHGGNLEQFNDMIAQKNGRYEYGPGLYLTTHYDTAKKYAKGGRKFYKITVNQGNDIHDSVLDFDKVTEFVKTYIISSKRKEIYLHLSNSAENNKIKAYILNNVILNHDAIKPSNTKYLRQFYIDNNIDYEIVDNPYGWGEKMMVLYNMRKIKNIQIITPKDKIDKYDLHK